MTINHTMEPKAVTQFLRRLVGQSKNVLSSPDSHDQRDITSTLQTLLLLSDDSKTEKASLSLPMLADLAQCDLELARAQFQSDRYTDVLRIFTDHLSVEWISAIPKGDSGFKLVESIFLLGPSQLSLLELSDTISKSRSGYKLDKCIQLLEQLLKSRLHDILWTPCLINNDTVHRELWPTIVMYLASLPDRVTGKQGTQSSEFFYPGCYLSHVSEVLHKTLSRVRTALQQGQSCSVEFLGQLLGKLALGGHSDALWDGLLPRLEIDLYKDAIWCRVCERLLNHVPDRCLESLVVSLLKKATWYETITNLLGHSVISNQKLKFLFTNKLIFLRHFSQDKVLQNIFGYLSHSTVTRPLQIKMMTTMIEVWGDGSALNHTSYEQHFYISRAIVISLAFLSDTDIKQLKEELIPKLMGGMQSHLGSAIPKVRHVGMAVAESVTHVLGPSGEQLKFEYPAEEDIVRLKSLLHKPEQPKASFSEATEIHEYHPSVSEPSMTQGSDASSLLPKLSQCVVSEDELDSDDDLEPYDMSDDVKLTKVKTPVYLRECMEGLISSDDPERIEVCLMSAETLIYQHSVSVKEIAVEFTKILLHLQNNVAIPGFLTARYNAMVALTVVTPIPVSDYLTSEVFARNYNTRQRIDILEILAAAAQKLSNPSDVTKDVSGLTTTAHNTLIQEVRPENTDPEPWRDIVEKRIASNTRRFVHGPQGKPLVASTNAFAPVAGHFFFKLLAVHDRRDSFLDLLGEDHLLLSRLIYTLGVVMYAALNAPIVRQMAKALLELTWSLRYHPEASVRRAILFALAMTLLAVPSHMLFTDLQTEIIDNKAWLEDTLEKDPDTDCKKLAVQSLMLLDKSLKQQFHNMDSR